MKKFLKVFIPVFVISIALSLLFIPAPAEAAKQESVWAAWSSEEAYLAAPTRPKVKSENAKIDSKLLVGMGYIHCYGDVDVSTEVKLLVGQNLTIELNGHTLTASAKIMVNGDYAGSWQHRGSLTIRNGSITHPKGQFIQGRANSEIYLENLKINAQIGGGNFITEGSSRILHFKDCEINFSNTAKGDFIETLAVFKPDNADVLKGKTDYVRNIVFENTVINDNTPIVDGVPKLYLISHKGTLADLLDISFTGTTSFGELRDNFLTDLCVADGNKLTVNIGKGLRFKEQRVPISTKSFRVNYYDSIAVDGYSVNFGNKTELITPGIEQDPYAPMLMWGKSASSEYPYQLCTYLVSVTWNIDGEETTVEGYADGVVLENDRTADTEGFKFKDDKKTAVTNETFDGWSVSSDFSNPMKKVKLTEAENKFYAVFTKRTVSIVEFADSTMTTIKSGVVSGELTQQDFDNFSAGSYVYFYTDAEWVYDDVCTVNKSLTLDFGGNKFAKNRLLSNGSGSISVEGDGTVLTLKNGSISSSLTSVATLTDGATIILDGVTATFDTAPAFNVISGKVELKYSLLEQRSADTFIPAFSLSSADSARVDVIASEIKLLGPFAVVSANSGELGSTEINVKSCNDRICPDKVCTSKICATKDCTDINCTHASCTGDESCTHVKKCGHDKCNVTAYSLLTVYDYSADAIPEGAVVKVNLDEVLLQSREVFDIGTKYNGAPALAVEAEISDGCYFTAKPKIISGELILPEDKAVLGFTEEGNPYSYMIATLELPDIEFNLILNEDFTANFYIPTDSTLTRVRTYLAGYAREELPVTAINGEQYYVVSVSGINPTSLLNAIEVDFSYRPTSDGIEYTAEFEYFVTEYFDKLLSESDPLVRKLAAAAMNYVATAYEYKECEITEEFAALLADERYTDVLRPREDLPNVISETDIGNLSEAFTGAQLYLSSDIYLRFNLREDFSGTISLDGNYYNVIEGKVGNSAYIQIRLEAQNFYEEIVEVSGTKLDGTAVSGSYSLIDYVNAMTTEESALTDFIIAFYSYCYEANVYQNDGVVPPVNDHTPPLDVELR